MSAELDTDTQWTHGRTVEMEVKLIRKALRRILRNPNDQKRADGLIAVEQLVEQAVKEYSGGFDAQENRQAEEG